MLALARPIGLGLLVFVLAAITILLGRITGRASAVWPANAFVLVSLIRSERRRWPVFLACAFIGNLTANLLGGDAPVPGAVLALSNTLESLICATGLHLVLGPGLDLTRRKDTWTFVGIAAVVAIASGLVGVGLVRFYERPDPVHAVVMWSLADLLGLTVVVPALLLINRASIAKLLEPRVVAVNLGLLALLAGTITYVSLATRFPFLFLITPVLLSITFRMEGVGAALGVLITATTLCGFVFAGHGPIAVLFQDKTYQNLSLQLFLLASVGVVFPVAATLAERRRLRASLKNSETRYRELADVSSDIIIRTNLNETIHYVSPACRQFGYEPGELVGRSAYELIHADDIPGIAELADALAEGAVGAATRREYRVRKADGDYAWVEGNHAIVRHEQGPDDGVEIIAYLRDVTERRALEDELRGKRAEAEAAAVAKAEFLANMSHEIRTPLTAIMGFSGLLDGVEGLSPEAELYGRRIATAGRSLMAVVNDILDFSKLESRQLELDPHPLNLRAFVEETLELNGAQAQIKGLTLSGGFADDLPTDVLVDGGRLRQILLNLLTNAIKFTETGGVEIFVDHLPPGLLRIAVGDTGIGIPEDRRDRLFQRFSQVDGSVSREHGGSGLGLAICRGLTALMGGEIGVDSVEGRGSTFWFTVAALPVDASEPIRATTIDYDDAFVPARILVVDDVAVNRELMRAMLSPFGHILQEASCGATAIEAAHVTAFDLILMDLQMPGMDGFETARAIRASSVLNHDTPIVAVSANVLVQHVAACHAAGMNDHIAKPIQPLELLAKVMAWTQGMGPETGEPETDTAL
ncbi:MAG: ATP-binding protein [Caulobacteraceae bacterium]|nr:ATP-binding protein [Caulobacteraceae bacterium]